MLLIQIKRKVHVLDYFRFLFFSGKIGVLDVIDNIMLSVHGSAPSSLCIIFLKQLTSFSLIEEQQSPKVYWYEFDESNWLGQRRKLLLMPVLRKRQKHESNKSTE